MNRQIKFRGKRADSGEWVYGDLLQIAGGCCIYFGSKTETLTPDIPEESNVFVELMDSECAVVIPDTVGQFTGLLDSKGKEIYEKDIIEAYDCHYAPYIVEWDDGEYDIYSPITNDCESLCRVAQYSKVIGNTYDPPEILKRTSLCGRNK